MSDISVIDFSKLVGDKTNKNDWLEIATQVSSACQGLGFLYIVNHGIPKETVQNALEAGTKFFNLPQSRKDDFKIDHKYRGYTKTGQETLDPKSSIELREAFATVGVESPQKFPDEIPELRKSVYALWNECSTLAKKIFKLFAIALELPNENHFLEANLGITDTSIPNQTTLRYQWYPPISDFSNIPENAIRCGEHTDYGQCTFLFQDMIGGLEVKNTQGCWVPATPIAEAILLNLGDVMEMWTGGRFKATPHRVLIPKEGRLRGTSRLSIAFFNAPDDDYIITPLKSSKYYDVGKDFEAMTFEDFLQKRIVATYK